MRGAHVSGRVQGGVAHMLVVDAQDHSGAHVSGGRSGGMAHMLVVDAQGAWRTWCSGNVHGP